MSAVTYGARLTADLLLPMIVDIHRAPPRKR